MGSNGGRERYGVVGREAAVVVDAVASMVDAFDPDLIGGRDAMDLVAELSRLEHLASAGLMLAARKVAQTDLWRRSGHPSAAQWLSHVTGVSVGEAIGLLETAEVVETAPDTREALKSGKVSGRLAKAIGKAEQADPDAARRLLDDAAEKSTKQTERDANRVVAAASAETPEDKATRHRAKRRFRHGVNDDGMGWGSWLLPIAEHTRAVAAIEGEQEALFDQARMAGVRESSEAYAADALCRVLDRADAKGAIGGDGGSLDTWSFAKVIVKVDLTALDRGFVEPGEVCEVVSRGPIPVADVWRMVDGDAFIAAVATRGTEISKVVHLGRRPTVLQRTALDWLGDGVCQIESCNSRARLEIDHVADWAATGRTELRQLARACGHHHDLKTHHGYTFGPLQPDGTRKLIPPAGVQPPRDGEPPGAESTADGTPDDAGPTHDTEPTDGTEPTEDTEPTDGTGPPRLTLHDGEPPPERPTNPPGATPLPAVPSDAGSSTADPAARARALARRRTRQGHLFDTG